MLYRFFSLLFSDEEAWGMAQLLLRPQIKGLEHEPSMTACPALKRYFL